MSNDQQELFSQKFLISTATNADAIDKEIALENGMEAKSTFLIRVNDKNEAHRISEIANIVRVALGKKNALILFENEKPI